MKRKSQIRSDFPSENDESDAFTDFSGNDVALDEKSNAEFV